MDTGGDLAQVAKALVESPEAWDPTPAKFKTPYEYTLSTWRLIGAEPSAIERLAPILTGLGQKPFSPPPPRAGPRTPRPGPRPTAWSSGCSGPRASPPWSPTAPIPTPWPSTALGARLTPPVAKAVSRAETRKEAFALLVMSPEFQRR
jgi:uncharacterized protein (DUF1800 family)